MSEQAYLLAPFERDPCLTGSNMLVMQRGVQYTHYIHIINTHTHVCIYIYTHTKLKREYRNIKGSQHTFLILFTFDMTRLCTMVPRRPLRSSFLAARRLTERSRFEPHGTWTFRRCLAMSVEAFGWTLHRWYQNCPKKHETTHQKDATAQHIFQICPMVFALLDDFG